MKRLLMHFFPNLYWEIFYEGANWGWQQAIDGEMAWQKVANETS